MSPLRATWGLALSAEPQPKLELRLPGVTLFDRSRSRGRSILVLVSDIDYLVLSVHVIKCEKLLSGDRKFFTTFRNVVLFTAKPFRQELARFRLQKEQEKQNIYARLIMMHIRLTSF